MELSKGGAGEPEANTSVKASDRSDLLVQQLRRPMTASELKRFNAKNQQLEGIVEAEEAVDHD